MPASSGSSAGSETRSGGGGGGGSGSVSSGGVSAVSDDFSASEAGDSPAFSAEDSPASPPGRSGASPRSCDGCSGAASGWRVHTAHAPSALPLTTYPSATRASAVTPPACAARRCVVAANARWTAPECASQTRTSPSRDAVSAYSPSKTTEVTSPECAQRTRRLGANTSGSGAAEDIERARGGRGDPARGAGWGGGARSPVPPREADGQKTARKPRRTI